MDNEILNLSAELGRLLFKKSIYFATAESCTGGGIATAMTETPGSSSWFDCGFVTYSNHSKIELLQVKADTLYEKGAVSVAVAEEMVLGALMHSKAQLAVSVTGIAGPEGGTSEKPVGTVYIASVIQSKSPRVEQYFFSGNRSEIRKQTVCAALKQAKNELS